MRTPLLSALLVLCCTFSVAAQEKAKPNTLTPQEIADGWILLFDGATTFGWTSSTGKPWKVDQGELISTGKDCPLRTTSQFRDFELQFEYVGGADKERALKFGAYSEGEGHPRRIFLYGNGDGWHEVKVTATGCDASGIIIDLPDKKKPVFPEATIRARAADPVPITFNGDALRLRNIKLRPLGAKPLFNGKNLTGWKVFPGKKSEFTVADGVIRVKNGPGDLQTEGKYGDFILQLECKSNGKHLNSGVFFRCKADEYQNGYEAQIHNGFASDKMKDYTVEEYDPRTHERTGKKKVQSAALDYGTGAIYRRVPARFQASKDGAWFTLTIVAHGNHFATWVNGVQQVDWYDNRPRSDNPRTGCRLEPGHLSIQGHDPTTDLSFRNIRLAELPAGK